MNAIPTGVDLLSLFGVVRNLYFQSQ